VPALLAGLLALASSGCALWGIPRVPRQLEQPWAADWNWRLDAAPTRFEHPCATLEFSGWADGFLETCAPYRSSQQGELELSRSRRQLSAEDTPRALVVDCLRSLP